MYPVINTFIANEHEKTKYNIGETYPKAGFKADAKRVKFLKSAENRWKVPFLGAEIKPEKKSEKSSDAE
ncbi:hypothetical protein [Sporosarcina sp. E16_8]|uniref:hypothetical protein n=1 Tax=Sporosarcina sp. E16_8 TaxID=2789295 RepID=UPI001A91CC54|nr:hypothetical protein [Sporosarcina sp. E16_8]MBO0586462.1 hypothetical protein [Sporosarcina sp. E16_8]